MTKLTRRTFGVATGALMLAMLAGSTVPASAQTLDSVKQAGKIRVGMLVDVPPFGLMSTTGQPEGFDADIAAMLAEYLGVELELVPVTGPNRIPYLLTGQVDVLAAALGITEERSKQIQFSQPYSGLGAIILAPVDMEVSSFDDLADRSVGLPRGGSQDPVVTSSALPSTQIQRYDDDAGAVQALLSNQVDSLAVATVLVPQIEQMAPGRYDTKFLLYSQVQGIGMRPGEADLLEQVDAFIAQARAEGKLEELYEKWPGTRPADQQD
ncbi:transporter substrate-binding domain-containing protein [Devosia naphthalenivorans]|uniref:transporter substrate-binding domain-containing protein n=1 Tax=Devosia naphthalenivorans TaxID=2082392 RepID=UPI000D3BC4BB|nr:transporter substrate-binding domain-containing protein [Devosia naphthalenivorans]